MSGGGEPPVGPDAPLRRLETLVRARLRPLSAFDEREAPARSDFDLNPAERPPGGVLAPAAVLVPLLEREGRVHVLLTRRSDLLRRHSGQVAFPGGRMEAGETPVEAALRESEEEIGLERRFVEPLGLGDIYETGTGFAIAPVVAAVRPGFTLTADRREVADIFEAPFAALMDPLRWERRSLERDGLRREFYAQEHEGRTIWGATAGVIRGIAVRLFGEG